MSLFLALFLAASVRASPAPKATEQPAAADAAELLSDLEEYAPWGDGRGRLDPFLKFAYERAREADPRFSAECDVPRLYEYDDQRLYPNRYRYFVRVWNSGELYRRHPFLVLSHALGTLRHLQADATARGALSGKAVERDLIDIVQFANRNWDLPALAPPRPGGRARTVGDLLGPPIAALKASARGLAGRLSPHEAPADLRGAALRDWPLRNGWRWLPVYHRVEATFGRAFLLKMIQEWRASRRVGDWEHDGGELYYALVHRSWGVYLAPSIELRCSSERGLDCDAFLGRFPAGAGLEGEGAVRLLAWLHYKLNQWDQRAAEKHPSRPPRLGVDRHGLEHPAIAEFLRQNSGVVLLRDGRIGEALTIGEAFRHEIVARRLVPCGLGDDFPSPDRPRGRAYKSRAVEHLDFPLSSLRPAHCGFPPSSDGGEPGRPYFPTPPARAEALIQWVDIPGGSFVMGSDEGDADERPRRRVRIAAFQMARTETTFGQYMACVDSGACLKPDCGSPSDSHPVVCVDHARARAFARWAGGRLPSEAEWEYAARGAGLERRYPWGDAEPDCGRAVTRSCAGPQSARPACSAPGGRTRQGLCDMAGNVWEWTEDAYCPDYRGAPEDGSPRLDCTGDDRVMRGGAWNYYGAYARAAYRSGDNPTHSFTNIGFRVARDAR